MPSKALTQWRDASSLALDEIEAAHKKVGGPKPGRRFATQRLTHAYALLLASQFQHFCRSLHSEAYFWILAEQKLPPTIETTLHVAATTGRLLDSKNATRETIGRDFRVLVLKFWDEVGTHDAHAKTRLEKLDLLNEWRNAIAHHDFTKKNASSERLWLREVQEWRRACNGLAKSMDATVSAALVQLVGKAPW